MDDNRGCIGYRRITGPLAGICIACDRLGRNGPQITPEARRVCGDWECMARIHPSTLDQRGPGAIVIQCDVQKNMGINP